MSATNEATTADDVISMPVRPAPEAPWVIIDATGREVCDAMACGGHAEGSDERMAARAVELMNRGGPAFDAMLAACESAQLYSDMTRENGATGGVAPDDPRYERFIGKWNGLHAPELRFWSLAETRRDLRVYALALVKQATL